MMVNLVRRNDILHLIDWYQTEYCETETYFEEFRRDIESWTAVDAVPVVRCGECKHMTADGRCLEFADDNVRPSVSDFCSYGQRRGW